MELSKCSDNGAGPQSHEPPREPEHFDVVLEARRSREWRELWQYRDLLYFLARRDALVRYKQTVIGVAWVVVRPLVTMAVFAFVFGRLAGLPSGGVPYPLFVFAALLPWQLFSSALQASSESLVNNSQLVSKIYFPRIVAPISAVAATLVDFTVSLVLMIGLVLLYGQPLTRRILIVPLPLAIVLAAALGLGLWFATLSARYRDFQSIVPFVIQVGLYVSPVGYGAALVPEHLRLWYALNPLVGVSNAFRWAFVGQGQRLDGASVAMAAAVSLALLVSGAAYFRYSEHNVADVI
jgi:lipopolysaccharide transport system permease protein